MAVSLAGIDRVLPKTLVLISLAILPGLRWRAGSSRFHATGEKAPEADPSNPPYRQTCLVLYAKTEFLCG